jgi:hypothetical protein
MLHSFPTRCSSDLSVDRERDEGYLFWLGWVAQNTNSLFSTSDATGPFRRALAGFNCTGIQETLQAQPVAGSIIGLSNVLNTAGLCGGDATETPGGPADVGDILGLPKQGKGVKGGGARPDKDTSLEDVGAKDR